jgi:hypothetical protein
MEKVSNPVGGAYRPGGGPSQALGRTEDLFQNMRLCSDFQDTARCFLDRVRWYDSGRLLSRRAHGAENGT